MNKFVNAVLVITFSHVNNHALSSPVNPPPTNTHLPETNQIQLNKNNYKGTTMSAKGQFEVSLTPQDDESPAGRMLIDKTYTGDLSGTGIGQMISKRTETGSAVYYAIEEFSGQLNGKSGAFTFIHHGAMDKNSQSLDVTILPGSGVGELSGISGTLQIIQDNGNHSYVLDYEL